MSKKRAYIYSTLVSMLILGIGFTITYLAYLNAQQERNKELNKILQYNEQILSKELLEKSQLAQVLAGMINTHPELNDSTFYEYTRHIESTYNEEFLSLQWAPNGIIKMVYPKEISEEALDLNLFEYEKTRNSVLKSFRTQKPHINGPLKLIQGGKGVIFRFPVFKIESGDNTSDNFLGFAAVVYDWKEIESKIQWQNETHQLALRFTKETVQPDSSVQTFIGDPNVFKSAFVKTSEVRNSFGNWTIGATLTKGNVLTSTTLFYLINTIILAIILGYWTYNNSIKAYYNKLQRELLEVKNKEIQKQIDEKIILLNEVHHRVKNNFQLISSLARLQSNELQDEASKKAFEAFSGRVSSLALTHEQLYKNESSKTASIHSYVTSLCTNLLADINKDIKPHLDITKNELPVKTVISLGIILNELITNSLKYAFSDTDDGNIFIQIYSTDMHEYVLEYTDSGKGLQENVLERDTDSFGIELIKSITEQLDGEIKQISDQQRYGFRITFKT